MGSVSPSLADTQPEATNKVEIRQEVTNGFIHPGIGLTKEVLENARAQVMARREPWLSGFRRMAADPNSAESVPCRNQSTKDPSKPDSEAFDNRGMVGRLQVDADRAYRQALMYWFTGKDAHRANALRIIRIWSKLDPNKCKSFPEDHIHASYPVQTLVRAAELVRCTSASGAALQWTAQDNEAFIRNFLGPAIANFFNQNGWFMNQNGYPLAAAMAGDIFTNDRPNYEKRVEWFTVNQSAPNKGCSSSITHLARLVDTNAITGEKVVPPVVQLMEMGRDQAHAADDVEIFMNTARLMNAQGTKVDPVTGTISTKPEAVGPYEFLDHRILAVADQFCRFMLGYETPWVPAPYDIAPDGTVRGIYPRLADNYRGRIRGLDIWDAHYYHTYVQGLDVAARYPFYHEAFTKRIVASGFDWIFIPKDVQGEGARPPETEQESEVLEIERRSTLFDQMSSVVGEDGCSFVRVRPDGTGARLAILSTDTDHKTLWMRVRTTGPAEIAMSRFSKPWLLPDTQGQWRQVAYQMGSLEHWGDIVFFTIKAAPGTQVDLDQLTRKPDSALTPPEFKTDHDPLRVVAYVGAPIDIDFSAQANGARITSRDKPAESLLNEAAGRFEWIPKQEGEFPFIVMAADGDKVTPRKVTILVTADRRAALREIVRASHPEIAHVEEGQAECRKLYDEITQTVEQTPDPEFFQKLTRLQSAFEKLEPLNPLLADGSLDFPKVVVSSNIGEQIALLADGNDDTFAVYLLAKDLNHVFDFGEKFRFSATAFALEGRLNFENRTQDTAFFGSDDAKTWTRLTPDLTELPAKLTRVEVEPARRTARFRYLKIQKMNKRSASLFEPAELRIYGQRFGQ